MPVSFLKCELMFLLPLLCCPGSAPGFIRCSSLSLPPAAALSLYAGHAGLLPGVRVHAGRSRCHGQVPVSLRCRSLREIQMRLSHRSRSYVHVNDVLLFMGFVIINNCSINESFLVLLYKHLLNTSFVFLCVSW